MTPYLLAHPNPHGQNYYPTRRGRVLAVVVHITAGLQGRPAGADSSAEQTAAYAASTDRAVSWHSGSDRDSSLRLLPDGYVAFHCKGYNTHTIGHEISKTDITWADEDPGWVTATLAQAAESLGWRADALGIPARHATKADLDRAIATDGDPVGFIGHSELDPTRRRDPGPDFPWDRFLSLLTPPEDEMTDADWARLDKLLDDKIRLVLRGQTADGKPTGHYSLKSVGEDIAALDVPRKKL